MGPAVNARQPRLGEMILPALRKGQRVLLSASWWKVSDLPARQTPNVPAAKSGSVLNRRVGIHQFLLLLINMLLWHPRWSLRFHPSILRPPERSLRLLRRRGKTFGIPMITLFWDGIPDELLCKFSSLNFLFFLFSFFLTCFTWLLQNGPGHCSGE